MTGPIKFDQWGKRVDFQLQVVSINRDSKKVVATWSPVNGNYLNFTRRGNDQHLLYLESLTSSTVIVSSKSVGIETNATSVYNLCIYF